MATVLVVKKTSAGYQVWDLETNTAVFASEFEDTANAYAANGQMTTEAFNKYRQQDINRLNGGEASSTPVTPVTPATTPIPVTNYSGGAVSYQSTDTPEARESLDKLQAQVDANRPTYERVWVKSDYYQGGGYYDLKEVPNATRSQTFSSATSNTAGDAVNDTPNPATQNTGKSSNDTAQTSAVDIRELDPNAPAPVTDSEKSNLDKNKSQVDYSDVDIRELDPNAPPPKAKNKQPSKEDATGAPTNATTTKQQIVHRPTDNPLHSFPSYTYGLSLHLLSAPDYKNLVNNPNNVRISKTLISSAMRYKSSRDPAFVDDFYFDSLKMKTVVALNSNSKGSNMVDLQFTIIEPYGMTLMDRILDINTKELNANNYLEMPYMLEINFFGGDDQGNMRMLTDQTKFIPIRIVDLKIRASVRGAEYQIQAVPFNHQANFMSTQATKANFEVTATKVSDFFKNTKVNGTESAAIKDGATQVTNADAQRKSNTNNTAPTVDQSPRSTRNTTGRKAPARLASTESTATTTTGNNKTNINSSSTTPTIKTQSYTAAYNAWNEQIKQLGGVGVADTIEFVFDEEIARADIIVPKKVGVDKAANNTDPNSNKDKNKDAKANDPNAASGSAGLNLNSQVFSINAGTAILSVIDMVVTNSSYIRNQLVDVEGDAAKAKASQSGANLSAAKGNTTVKWYKVIPKVELKEFDKTRNKWGKHIVFYVKTFEYYNSGKDQRLPTTKIPGHVKDYQYIYTGHNKDIIDFDLDFNAVFFTSITVARHKMEATLKAQNADGSKLAGKTENKAGGSVQPVVNEVVVGDAPSGAGGASQRSETQNAQSVKNSIYSDARGDMLNLNLRIIGDPDFIKQDDILYNPGVTGMKDTNQFVKGNSGSLNMDSGEIYCKVTFNTPVDFDDQTGLLRKNSRYSVSNFTGDYKVMMVDSEFRAGKFTQTLNLIRQMGTDTKSATSSTNERKADNGINNKADNSKVPGQNSGQATIINGKVTSAMDPNAWGSEPDSPSTGQANITNGRVTSALDPNAWGDGSADVVPPPASENTTSQTEQQKLQDVAKNGDTQPINNTNSNSDGTSIVQTNSTNNRIAEIQTSITKLNGQVNYLLQGQDPATLKPGTETYMIYQELQNNIKSQQELLNALGG